MQEVFNSIILTQLNNIGPINAKYLYDKFGSATCVLENKNNIRDVIPDATNRLIDSLQNTDHAKRIAEAELEYIEQKHIRALCMNNPEYPQRMKNCDDAPIILFYYGNADLNAAKIISMVGTRKCTDYGKELCHSFISDIKKNIPDTLIVSGLAFGIDIHSHRAALNNNMGTVGVVAHGLERIYPAVHRETASKMIKQGGVLTEYIHNTVINGTNFLKRNRIIAGISDCTIVVESASHGGSLVTAGIANAYNRDVFAFPGRVFDENSIGCNKLIANNKAILIQNANDFLKRMGWETQNSSQEVTPQLQLPLMTEDEEKIYNCLKDVDDKPINMLVNETGMNYGKISSIIFDMEAKKIVSQIGGARVRINHYNK